MKYLPLVVIMLLMLFPAVAGGVREPAVLDDRDVIAVTIVPEETFVKAVTGDTFSIVVMVPPGSSPETYEPTPKQKAALEKADVYLAIGVPSEMAVLPSVKAPIVDLGKRVSAVYPDLMLGGERDPHIWLSVRRVLVMLDVIVEEASRLKPEKRAFFQANAQAYKQQLHDADDRVRDSLKGLQGSSFMVFHPAFGYFAHEYGLHQYALEEDGKEATAQHLARMVDLAKKERCKVVFYQAETDSRQSKAFAEAIGGVTVQLEPLSGDYLGNLGRMADAFKAGR